jgi:hypothetical protein
MLGCAAISHTSGHFSSSVHPTSAATANLCVEIKKNDTKMHKNQLS